jgi:glycosyltransferase involved in cell wall biosynthesis
VPNKKILFVTTHFPPDYHFGGIVESGSKLLEEMRKIDSSISLVCVSKTPDKVRELLNENDLCAKSNFYHDWGISISLIFSLWNKVREADVCYINGIVTFPVTLATIYCILLNKKFIVATRGSLEPWRVNYKKWKKHFYYNYIVLPLIKKASAVHVTAKEEQFGVQQFGYNGNFVVIPNGIKLEDYAKISPFIESEYKGKFNILFLSRISKVKGLDILTEAFDLFQSKYNIKDAILLLVGPDNENYLKTLNIVEESNIKYLGSVYNEEKINLMRSVDLFVLPSYSENFGNVVAEAMASECPVITTTGTPWEIIEKINCGIYIEPDVNQLVAAIYKIYSTPIEERKSMGKRGKEYVFNNFDWKVIGSDLYAKLNTL